MSGTKEDLKPQSAGEGDAFCSRWSRRKLNSGERQGADLGETPSRLDNGVQPPSLTDADMPPIESLTEASDYSGFLSPEVTEQLRQQALQKLFRSACFNVCDGLDDYAEDFTSFEKLGDVITADLKFRMQQEAERLKQQAALAEQEDAESPQQADESISETDNVPVTNEQSISQDDEDESEASV